MLGFVLGVLCTVAVVGLLRKPLPNYQAMEAQVEYEQSVELAKLKSELDFMSDRLGAVSTLVMMHPYHAPGMVSA